MGQRGEKSTTALAAWPVKLAANPAACFSLARHLQDRCLEGLSGTGH